MDFKGEVTIKEFVSVLLAERDRAVAEIDRLRQTNNEIYTELREQKSKMTLARQTLGRITRDKDWQGTSESIKEKIRYIQITVLNIPPDFTHVEPADNPEIENDPFKLIGEGT